MLDSPALIDLGHGTVRYRHPDEKRVAEQENTKVKTGYFYHPCLDDFSEGEDNYGHLCFLLGPRLVSYAAVLSVITQNNCIGD